MSVKSIIRTSFISIFISIFAVTYILTTDDSFAARRHGRGIAPRSAQYEKAVVKHRDSRIIAPRARHGRRFLKHRDRHRIIRRYRDLHFPRRTIIRRPFIHRHIIHRHFPSRHFIARPRLRVFFTSIPIGYRTIWIDDRQYLLYNNNYYQRVPSGYVAVKPEPPVLVVRESANVVDPPDYARGKVSVDVSTLNVHSGPTLNHRVTYQLEKGSIVEVYGKSEGWLYVHLPNGEFGWIKTAFTTEAEPPGDG